MGQLLLNRGGVLICLGLSSIIIMYFIINEDGYLKKTQPADLNRSTRAISHAIVRIGDVILSTYNIIWCVSNDVATRSSWDFSFPNCTVILSFLESDRLKAVG